MIENWDKVVRHLKDSRQLPIYESHMQEVCSFFYIILYSHFSFVFFISYSHHANNCKHLVFYSAGRDGRFVDLRCTFIYNPQGPEPVLVLWCSVLLSIVMFLNILFPFQTNRPFIKSTLWAFVYTRLLAMLPASFWGLFELGYIPPPLSG